tara:strand:+ start:345 stop:500 length:156 start_codon:yes stop_codon:yes gene_type:complete
VAFQIQTIESLKKENRPYFAGVVNVDYEVLFNIGYNGLANPIEFGRPTIGA